ncbi:MAG: Asp-tRNA(Asn)/Glu-tRNA(Gln) amidotransferase subunit GatC [Gemmatimonadaceae bacterium]
MSVSLDDVRHVALLARVGLTDERAAALVAELNTILQHMDVLSPVDTTGVELAPSDAAPTVLRADEGPAIPLARPRESFAPKMRDGFFLVPRLDTHEDAGGAS